MAEAYLLEKLKSVEQTFHELTRRLADPDTAQNQSLTFAVTGGSLRRARLWKKRLILMKLGKRLQRTW